MRGLAARVAALVAALGLVWLLLLPASAVAGAGPDVIVQWTQNHFDAAHDGFNPYETTLSTSNVGGLGVKWTAHGTASLDQMTNPLVTTTTVYGAGAQSGPDSTSWLMAFDRATGALLWEASQPDGLAPDGIATLGTRVFIATAADHALRAYDAASGDPLWKFQGNGSLSPPTIAYGTIFTQSDNFVLYALDPATGHLRWSVSDAGEAGASPAAAGSRLFVETGMSNSVQAFDARTGALLWTTPVDSLDYGAPTAVDGMVFLGSGLSTLYALDQTTGEVVWQVTRGSGFGSTPAVANGIVYEGDSKGNLYAFRESDGKVLWRAHTQDSFGVSSPTLANGVVYAATLGAYAFDALTGARLWRASTDDAVSGPALVDGVLYVADFSGQLHAYALSPTAS